MAKRPLGEITLVQVNQFVKAKYSGVLIGSLVNIATPWNAAHEKITLTNATNGSGVTVKMINGDQ